VAPEPEEQPETDVDDASERDDASDDIDEVPLLEASLDELAATIRTAWVSVKRHDRMADDARFAMGRALLEGRRRMPSDKLFGRWCAKESFGFSRQYRRDLMLAAANEAAMRALLTTCLSVGEPCRFSRASSGLSSR